MYGKIFETLPVFSLICYLLNGQTPSHLPFQQFSSYLRLPNLTLNCVLHPTIFHLVRDKEPPTQLSTEHPALESTTQYPSLHPDSLKY